MALKIGIAPGHSLDASPEQVWEHHRCLQATFRLAFLLERSGMEVVMPEPSVFDMPNDEALLAKIAHLNEHEVDVALELHLNAAGTPAADYSCTIHWGNAAGAISPEGRRLGGAICAEMAHTFPHRTIGPRAQTYFRKKHSAEEEGRGTHAYFAFVSKTDMPAVIVEAGFKTNPAQRALFSSPHGPGLYAVACYQGICRFAACLHRRPRLARGRPLVLRPVA